MDDNTHPSLLLHFLEATWKTCEASPWSCLSWWLFALTPSPRSVHLAVPIPTTRITYCSGFSLHMSFSSWISFRSSSVCLPTVGFIAKACQYVCVFGLDLPSRKKTISKAEKPSKHPNVCRLALSISQRSSQSLSSFLDLIARARNIQATSVVQLLLKVFGQTHELLLPFFAATV